VLFLDGMNDLRLCSTKSVFLEVKNEKCLFLTQEKPTITSAKTNYNDIKI
jgi:hypothetical protein